MEMNGAAASVGATLDGQEAQSARVAHLERPP